MGSGAKTHLRLFYHSNFDGRSVLACLNLATVVFVCWGIGWTMGLWIVDSGVVG
jgi:hypothetical protein